MRLHPTLLERLDFFFFFFGTTNRTQPGIWICMYCFAQSFLTAIERTNVFSLIRVRKVLTFPMMNLIGRIRITYGRNVKKLHFRGFNLIQKYPIVKKKKIPYYGYFFCLEYGIITLSYLKVQFTILPFSLFQTASSAWNQLI